jgi:hypothetical protein
MGQMYDTVMAIQKAIERRGLDAVTTRGSIGLKSGVLLALVKPDTPDDAAKIERFKAAAKDVLGVAV